MSEEIQSLNMANEGWTILLDQKVLTKNFKHKIKLHCSKDSIQQYWCYCFSIKDQAKHLMDWTTVQKTLQLLPASHLWFISKQAAGISATGQNMYRRQQRDTDQCPRCGARNEDHRHVFQCTGCSTTTAFNTGLAQLRHWLSKSSSIDITIVIVDLVEAFRNQNDDYKAPEDTPDQLSTTIEAQ